MNDNEKVLLEEFKRVLFYEQTHLAIYSAQAKRIDDLRIASFFDRFVSLEQQHVEKMTRLVEKLNGEPGLLNQISPTAGYLGTAILRSDITTILKSNLYLENKAVHGYERPIKMAQEVNPSLADFMIENQCEAELMGLWIREELTRYGIDVEATKASFTGSPVKNKF